jgi:virulence-associated protein VagC
MLPREFRFNARSIEIVRDGDEVVLRRKSLQPRKRSALPERRQFVSRLAKFIR